MEFGQIIYIVAIVAYFLYRASSKKKSTSIPDGESTAPDAPQKGFSFEELLREIRESQEPKVPEVVVDTPPVPKANPAHSSSKQKMSKKRAQSSQEVIVAEGVDYEAKNFNSHRKNPTYSHPETSSSIDLASRPKFYEQPVEVQNPYAELLRNPKSIRDAVVVSEILKPKHF